MGGELPIVLLNFYYVLIFKNMPCNSDYMNATGYETEMSHVYCLLDELDGKVINSAHWEGYHPEAYGKSNEKDKHNKATEKLCYILQKSDVTKYSLEMQIWWREHQKADKERVLKEMKQYNDNKAKEIALSKLSAYERNLLGL